MLRTRASELAWGFILGFMYLRVPNGRKAAWGAVLLLLLVLGLVTLVLLFANSSLRVWGRSGSNRTPCCKCFRMYSLSKSETQLIHIELNHQFKNFGLKLDNFQWNETAFCPCSVEKESLTEIKTSQEAMIIHSQMCRYPKSVKWVQITQIISAWKGGCYIRIQNKEKRFSFCFKYLTICHAPLAYKGAD